MTFSARARTRTVRAAVVVLVAVVTITMVGMLAVAARGIGNTTTRIGNLTNFMTGLAISHREVLKMEVASQLTDVAAMTQIKLRRQLLERQLSVTLGGIASRSPGTKNPHLLELQSALSNLDQVLGSMGPDAAPSAELRQVIFRLEVATKHLYDFEGLRYFALTNDVVEGKEKTERVLVALAVMTIMAGLLLMTVLYRVFRHNLRSKAKELRLALHSLERSQADRARLLNDAIDATERERVWLAAELHDGPVQALSALCYSMDRMDLALQRGNAEPAKERMGSTREELAGEVDALRRLMSELRPPALDHGGIDDALSDYVAAFASRTGIDCRTTFEAGTGRDLPLRLETVVYRIVQESLTNISRHASAENVVVELRRLNEGDIELVVEDDGVGFASERRPAFVRNGHFGLAGMGERAAMVGGDLKVTSNPGAGTRIVARFPIQVEECPTDDHTDHSLAAV